MSGFFQDQFSKSWNMILKLFSRKSWNENRMLIFFKIGRLGLEEKDRKEQFLHYSSCAWCTYSAILPLPVYDNLEEDISLFPSDSNLLFQLSKYFLIFFLRIISRMFLKMFEISNKRISWAMFENMSADTISKNFKWTKSKMNLKST